MDEESIIFTDFVFSEKQRRVLMKKVLKKLLASLLCAAIIVSAIPLGGLVGIDWSELLGIKASAYSTGDTLYFGMYPQTKVTDATLKAALGEVTPDSNGDVIYLGTKYRRYKASNVTEFYRYAPIRWRVLSSGYDGIYVVSVNVLDRGPYNEINKDITWADCTLRSWLNTTFYNTAFSESDKAKIRTATLINDGSPYNNYTSGGIDTKDKVFILSYYDVISDEYGLSTLTGIYGGKASLPSDYAKVLGVSGGFSYGGACWWTRTPGDLSNYALCFSPKGEPLDRNVSLHNFGIRPALKLNLNSGVFESKTNSQYSLKIIDSETNKPISGATLEFGGVCYTTANDGTLKISVGSSVSNSEMLKITKDGYASKQKYLYELNLYSCNEIKLSQDFNISQKIADICLEGEKIYGPKVNVLGQEFSLFNFDAKIKIPLAGVNISVKQDTNDHTVKVMIGVKDGYSYDSDAKWNEDYKEFKDYYQSYVRKESDAETLKKYNKLRDKLKSSKGNIGFDCSMTASGFLEFDYSTGTLDLKSGGFVVTAEAAVSQDVPFAAICYATFKIGGEIEGKFTVTEEASGCLGFSTSIALSVKPTIGVGAKLISKDVASVEVGIDGKITGSVTIPASSFAKAFEAYLSANVYVKVKALWIFEDKWTTNYPKLELYPNFGLQTQSLTTQAITEDTLELISREYLNTLRTQALGDINENSVYPYGVPKLVQLDDGRVAALYIYDDGTKSAINRTTLYFSVYENDTWSNPTPVFDSGFADFPVEVCTDGTKIYAVWQRATEVFEDTYKVDDIVGKTELVYAVYDGAAWSEPVSVDSNGDYQLLYDIGENNGEIAIVWAENSENDYTLMKGTTTVYKKTLTGSVWSDASVVTSAPGIAGVSVGSVSSNLSVAYVLDKDGDLTTTGDSEIYIDGTAITDDSSDDYEITYQNGAFYWIKDGVLYSYNGTASSTGLSLENDYRVISNGTKTAVTYIATEGFKNELMVSYLGEDGTFSQPVSLTDYGKHISYYDAIYNADGGVSVLANVNNLSGNDDYPYTTTDMVCDIIGTTADLAVSNAQVDGTVAMGSTININGTVTNKSTDSVDYYSVTVTNEAGEVVRTITLRDTLGSGESADFSIECVLPDDFAKQTYTVTVTADEDVNASNNSYAIELGYSDITVVGASINENGDISAIVVNNGCDTAENVSVDITAYGATDVKLSTINCGNIAAGTTRAITYSVDSSYLDFDSPYVVNKFNLKAETNSTESTLGNNDVNVIFAPKAVEGIALSTKSMSLTVGSTSQLSAAVYPSDAYNQKVHWITDSTNVVTVDENGNLTAVGKGKAIITAITDDGGFVSECEVNTVINVTGIQMTAETAKMNVGETKTISYVIDPAAASNQAVTWTSSDVTVASVSGAGVITAHKSGTTTITVTTEEGGYADSCELTVINAVKGITISDTSVLIYTGKTKQLSASVTPADADNQAVIWSSSDEDVAFVDSNGLVTAGSTGAATITVTSVDGGYKASCSVTVSKHVTGIYLSDSAVSLVPGLSHQLTATVIPLNALNKDVMWASTNEAVATVDENGLVTAHKSGNTIIIAETVDGNHTQMCEVVVSNSAAGYTLNSHDEYIGVNGTVTLEGAFTPPDAVNQTVFWTTSDESIATVDDSGKVSGKKAGSVVITVTTQDGGYKDYCIVRVVGICANLSTNAYVDAENGYIYGIDAGITSADEYLTLDDNSCTLEYAETESGFGTGTVVNVVRDEKIVDSYTLVLRGDVDGNGIYNRTDAEIIENISTSSIEEPSEVALIAADADHDGEIGAGDVELVTTASNYLATIPQEKYGNSDEWKIYSHLIDQTYDATGAESMSIVNSESQRVTGAEKGEAIQLVALYKQAKVGANAKWTSSNTYAATVDENGVLTAKGFGKTTVSAEDEFGRKATIVIQITDNNAHITIGNYSASYSKKIDWWKPYSSATMSLYYKLYDCAPASVKWTSDNPNVIVDSEGNITNKGAFARKAKITVTAYAPDGSKICSNSVTVSFYKFRWQNSYVSSMSGNELSETEPIWIENAMYSIGLFFSNIKNIFALILK